MLVDPDLGPLQSLFGHRVVDKTNAPHHSLIKLPRTDIHHVNLGVMYIRVLEREFHDLASHERGQGTGRLGEGSWAFNVFFVVCREGDGVEVCGCLGSWILYSLMVLGGPWYGCGYDSHG